MEFGTLIQFLVLLYNTICQCAMGQYGMKGSTEPKERTKMTGTFSTTYLNFYAFVSFGPGIKRSCGAAVIAPSVIVTAAHCVSYNKSVYWNPGDITIRYGHKILKKMKVANAAGVVVHEDFYLKNLTTWERAYNDIALIILDKPLTTKDKIKPIPLANAPAAGDIVWTAGFGWKKQLRTHNPVEKISHLMKMKLSIIGKDKCNEMLSRMPERNELCAIAVKSNLCQGNSGSPLYSVERAGSFKLVGVSSMIHACDDNKYPSIFSGAYSLSDWITEKIENYQEYIGNELVWA